MPTDYIRGDRLFHSTLFRFNRVGRVARALQLSRTKIAFFSLLRTQQLDEDQTAVSSLWYEAIVGNNQAYLHYLSLVARSPF